MKRLFLFLTAFFLAIACISCDVNISWGYSGNCPIWAYKNHAFIPRNFPGTQAGFNDAKAFVGQKGYITVYDDCDFLTIGTLPDSVTVFQVKGGKISIFGRAFELVPRGTQRFLVDSTGVSLGPTTFTQNVVIDDSLRVPRLIVSDSLRVPRLLVSDSLRAAKILVQDSIRAPQIVATNGIISRLGPASGPTSGGAIRIVDGVTFPQDSTGIANAVAELIAAGGGILAVPSGEYWISTPLTLASNIELRFAAGAKLRATASTLAQVLPGLSAVIYVPGNATNVKITGGEIDGNWHGGAITTTQGILLGHGTTDCEVRDMYIHNSGWSGVFAYGLRNKIANCTFDSCAVAGAESQGSYTSIMGNHVTRSGFATSGVGGIDIEGRSRDGYVQQRGMQAVGNIISRCRNGIYVGDSLYAVNVVGNTIYDVDNNGIYAASTGASDIDISSNIVRKTGDGVQQGRGISVTNASKFKIIGNTVDSANVVTNSSAIQLEGTCSDGVVSSNYCTNSWLGIGIADPVADVLVIGNKFRGNSGANYYNVSTGARVQAAWNSLGDATALQFVGQMAVDSLTTPGDIVARSGGFFGTRLGDGTVGPAGADAAFLVYSRGSQDLLFETNGILRGRWFSTDGKLHNYYSMSVDDSARFNKGIYVGGDFISKIQANTYTPTSSVETNLDTGITFSNAQFSRLGSIVTVSGQFVADPTITATATSFEITLPVASNLAATGDVAGVAFCGAIASQGAQVLGITANDTAQIRWVATDVTSQLWSYTFTYTVK